MVRAFEAPWVAPITGPSKTSPREAALRAGPPSALQASDPLLTRSNDLVNAVSDRQRYRARAGYIAIQRLRRGSSVQPHRDGAHHPC